MARARNIKPGFFSNDDLADIHPLGRLLFIGLWTIADREGRMEDRPRRIKAEVLPYDDCDVDSLLDDLQKHGFIQRYEVGGERFIQVVNFKKHQNPHVKESASAIPAPDEHHTSPVQEPDKEQPEPEQAGLIPDSLLLNPDSPFLSPDSGTQREADPEPQAARTASPPAPQSSRAPKATRLSEDWALPDDWLAWALQERADWSPAYAHSVADQFRDYWCAKGGADARKVDWFATWRNWVRRERQSPARTTNVRPPTARPSAYEQGMAAAERAKAMIFGDAHEAC